MTFAIATDSIGVADLREMRNRFGQGLPLQPQRVGAVPVGRPVVVELITAITAGDYSQHLAKLLTLSNGVWVDTAQRVYVRCVSDENAAAETRFIAEPVAGLGLCFDVCSCGYLDAITISCGRAIKLVGQVAAATGLEDTDWETDSGEIPDVFGAEPLYCNIAVDAPPDILGDAFGNPDLWVRNMMPVRWTLGDVNAGTTYRGGMSVNEIQLESSGSQFAMCATTPPADSHLAPMRLTSIDIDIPIGANVSYEYQSSVTHYRVWVGGVDVTGVVAVNWQMGYIPRGLGGSYPGTLTIPIPEVVETAGESVDIDLWVQFKVQDVGITGEDFNTVGWATYSQRLPWYYNGISLLAFLVSLNSANANLNRRRGDLYELTFSDNGPGGVSSLVLEPQSGWDTIDVGSGGILMVHQSTQDYVYFNWATEIPELIVNIQARSGKPDYRYSGEVRFYPVPDDNYEYTSGNWFSTPWVFSYGAWNCQDLTTFAVQGRRNVSTQQWLTKVKLPSGFWADWFGYHPTTITVEKV